MTEQERLARRINAALDLVRSALVNNVTVGLAAGLVVLAVFWLLDRVAG